MTNTSIIHEFAVLLTKQCDGQLAESTVKEFYANYCVAVKTLTDLDKEQGNNSPFVLLNQLGQQSGKNVSW